MPEQVTFESFLRLIEDMVENKESGVLYLRTDSNRSVFVGIRNGEIETLVSGLRRGMKAIKTILEMSSGSYRRDRNSLALQSGDLPPTAEILQILKDRDLGDVESELSEFSELGEPSEITVPLDPLPKPSSTSIDPSHTAKVLCDILYDYIGPAAPIVCDDVIQGGALLGNAADVGLAIKALANEIDSGTEANEFIRRAHERLGVG